MYMYVVIRINRNLTLSITVWMCLEEDLILNCRAQLERARQAKEDAEREKHELAERLQKYEQDTKKAEEGKKNIWKEYTYMYIHVQMYIHACT